MGKDKFVPLAEAKRKKKIDLEYNNKTEQSYIEQGLMPPENLNQEIKSFLAKVDPKVEPIVRTVSKIVRLKAIDYNTPKRERKEYLIYYINMTGRDWLRRIVPPVTDFVEGRYEEVITEPYYEQQELSGYKYSGKRQVHYIPFSKEKVDEIIASSMGSDKDTLLYTFIYDSILTIELPYILFTNSSFDDLEKIVVAPNPRVEIKKQLEELRTKQNKQKQ